MRALVEVIGLLRPPTSEELSQLFRRQVAVSEYLEQQAGTDRLPGVDRDHSRPAVRVPHEVMASLHPDDVEARFPKGGDEFPTIRAWEPRHEASRTRWIPTNSSGVPADPSTSRQSSIASTILSRSSSRERACV